jgi:hypothetical protein
MPILELPPNPSRSPQDSAGDTASDRAAEQAQPIKVRTGRFGELEEHELIHLLDSLDDERSRARFRESVYISVIVYLVIAWFLFYGPRVLFHQPEYRDPIALMKQHDRELTLLAPHNIPKMPPPHPIIDRKTMQQLQQQARLAAPTPPPPAPLPPQQQEAHPVPPVAQPPLPLPSAPKPASSLAESSLPSEPKPNFAQNNSARGAVQDAVRGAFGGRSGLDYGPSNDSRGPLQAGATILSDTMGVDFSAYMRRLHDDIQRNWYSLMPEEVQPPLSKRGIVGIRFSILPNGDIGAMTLETRSGDVALDHAAWSGITSEGQFPPLPKAFRGPQLELRVGFYYNIPLAPQ